MMQPIEHLIESIAFELGMDSAFQTVYKAVNQAPESSQAQQLCAAFDAVIERKKQQQQEKAWMETEMSRDWTLKDSH